MPILRRDRRLRTCGFRQILISSLEFGDDFENSISAPPNQFANRAGQEDASAGSAAARLDEWLRIRKPLRHMNRDHIARSAEKCGF